MSPSLAVVTIVHGRHEHLVGQLRGLLSGSRAPDLHVVVAMDDHSVDELVGGAGSARWPTRVVHVPRDSGRLPLAAARNRGVAEAIAAGCQELVLLDVDCIPDGDLLRRYSEVLQDGLDPPTGVIGPAHGAGPVVLCGEVRYLPASTGGDPTDPAWLAAARPHPARPVVPPGAVRPDDDVTLFWSLSFAMTDTDWCAVGGFDESYVGYGGEDTDFGQRLRRAGGRLLWVGGAMAFHQHHPVQSPPVQHLEDIVRNANLFAARWGWWPMEGWLAEFQAAGLAARSRDGRWHVVGPTVRLTG
ncbi:MAG: galactosyltransferase-related protein [Ornithinibacter sp.]